MTAILLGLPLYIILIVLTVRAFKQGKKGRGMFLIVLMAVLAPVLAICVPLIELIILFGFE